MRVTKISNPATQAENEYQAARAAQAVADIEYIAMMTGVDIFEDEEAAGGMAGTEVSNE